LNPRAVFVAGIHTDAGKSLAAAWLCLHLDAAYWKPVQAGVEPHTDTEWVAALTGLPSDRFLPERYRLAWPASPHAAAAQEGLRIRAQDFELPRTEGPLVVEGAGGLLVPLSDELLMIDLLAAWRMPTVLVVRTYLGCINHALLSIEALRHRGIPLAGLIFNDGGRPESEAIILQKANAPLWGRIPYLAAITRESLLAIPPLQALEI
jgi:dethiobiotin synthetase